MTDEVKKDPNGTDGSDEPTSTGAGDEAVSETDKGNEAPLEAGTESSEDSNGVEVPEKFKALVEQVETMSVLELHELVKVLEKKFDVSAAAVAVAAPGAAAGGDDEQDAFTVTLKDVGAQKIQVIKAVKELLGLGLKEAKDLVDGAPAELKKDVKKEEAEEIAAKIKEAGGTAEIS